MSAEAIIWNIQPRDIGQCMNLTYQRMLYHILFKALKNSKKFEWNTDCQSAFEDIKRFLTSPPLLNRPITGEDLYLYLSVGNESLASILVRED